ncbi:penicillin-binding protein [Pseudomonas agarici]|uniref:Penicillin-binding protein n=1 Tax=Pseudomonas agarici TaxID=46677 RepID=A0A0X1SXN1_PSEAA|nr:D-alanyl-D-alanine carboxypeptidase/D-alanyl-D-alanine-endopeptidase [Pseudomonas agarici]AMB84410.1 penicillin-binding protein [Pseudomonas agarici]NWB89606.1 D-alanyl-D-alanine carboxypeptidase/D-alanyl-D-alanine-endopeptidase [Pseudomonas agarici]NWC10334.1 D-alanyl-D-alanine carboxypeptidase/D-alanyl-D-alanine-endopeptidase [Pseudomonas agarici]SEK21378.1 D-alanyl-D-alanine carboxypeptidase / D-alanyl-D-alanine-endopeptidase (penicillin-binding protein 4) [Pseudomonas agarici]
MKWLQGCIGKRGATAVLVLLSACSSHPPKAPEPKRTVILQAAQLPLPLPRSNFCASLDSRLRSPVMQGALTSLVVREADGGKLVCEYNAQTRLVPASSLKLVTTAAAMEVLGANYRFATSVLTTGTRQGGLLVGDLYLRGTGDPTMRQEDYQALAAELARQGITRVRGRLILDDTAFDRERLGLDWERADEQQYFSAQISALSVSPNDDFDAGSILVNVSSAGVRQPPRVSFTPDNRYMTLINRATTGRAGPLLVSRGYGGNLLRIDGALPKGARRVAQVSVWEPTGLVADLFRSALVREGIVVEGASVLGVATPAMARSLIEHQSPVLADLMAPLLKLSNNNMAEILLKSMGRKTANAGTATAGAAAVNGFLRRHGISPTGLQQVDGSGLSRSNQISAQTLGDLLLAVRTQPWFQAWYAALPVAGNPERMIGGTLRKRLRGTAAANNVHAKTGSLRGVSSLAGYVTDRDGRLLVFALLTNNYEVAGRQIKALENSIVESLANKGD